MAERKVDIVWTEGAKLMATLRWPNKRGGYIFSLRPSVIGACYNLCPFNNNQVCAKHNQRKNDLPGLYQANLCSGLKGDNKFENRDKIYGWQPVGELVRKRKNRI